MGYFGFETGAFSQLTRRYMLENFNPKTPDVHDVRFVLIVVFFKMRNPDVGTDITLTAPLLNHLHGPSSQHLIILSNASREA
jgi:hypothetical protein